MEVKDIIKKITGLYIVFYILIVGILYIFQKKMIYFPDNTTFFQCDTFSKDEQKSFNGTKFYEQRGNNDAVIVFFHGNAGRACDRITMKNILERTGHSLLFVEYHGYSNRSQSPNITSILNDVENIGKYIQGSNYKKTYVIGRSIGSGPASYYTKYFPSEKLILLSPYTELYKVAAHTYSFFPVKHLFTENYEPINYLKSYNKQVLIIHGEQDSVIPFSLGEELFLSLRNQSSILTRIKQGTHHNLLTFTEIQDHIVDFLIRKK